MFFTLFLPKKKRIRLAFPFFLCYNIVTCGKRKKTRAFFKTFFRAEQKIMQHSSTKDVSYKSTITACFFGYIVQSIVNTFVPLLFLTFQSEYGIPLSKITALISINFFLQLCMDTASAFFVEKIGYRTCAVLANAFAAAGLIFLTFLPSITPDPFVGLLLSVITYAVGGGLLEVIISPIVEACPSKHKAKTMSFLHSFYAWGSVAAVCISTLFFSVFGTARWRILSLCWSVVPVANAILFLFVPMVSLIKEGEVALSVPQLLKKKTFWLLFIVILCAGAAEAAIVQWSSTFAEKGLNVSKTVGDLAGPALFSVFMGLSRVIYGKFGDKINLKAAIGASGILCIASYLIMALSPSPVVSFVGMSLCGFSVGLMWPGTYSIAGAEIKGGGGTMFAFLALGGDIGCVSGPAVVGLVAETFGGKLQRGILVATLFPLLLCIAIFLSVKRKKASPILEKESVATVEKEQENSETNDGSF